MIQKHVLFIIAFCLSLSVMAQETKESKEAYLKRINKEVGHNFKELKTGVTIEVERVGGVVKIYMLVDDIEQFDELLVERSDQLGTNYAQCKSVTVVKGKYKNNYVEVIDQYPLSPKMSPLYRLKTITAEGITRMYAPVAIVTN